MKKILSLLCSLIFIMLLFSGCSNKTNLTADIANQYLRIDLYNLNYHDHTFDSGDKYYKVSGEINGIPGFMYSNVKLILELNFYDKYNDNIDSIRVPVYLDAGGYADIDIEEPIDRTDSNKKYCRKYADYSIVEAFGTISAIG